MSENVFERNNGVVRPADRLPMGVRLPFQRIVFEKMGIANDPDRVLLDGKFISDFIDNPDNAEVRNLILSGKYEEASEIVIAEVRKMEERQHAA
jgi:hypothetical protein